MALHESRRLEFKPFVSNNLLSGSFFRNFPLSQFQSFSPSQNPLSPGSACFGVDI